MSVGQRLNKIFLVLNLFKRKLLLLNQTEASRIVFLLARSYLLRFVSIFKKLVSSTYKIVVEAETD